jgi:hypothetical protein
MLTLLFCATESFAETNINDLPLGTVIKLKPAIDNQLAGATVKIKRISNGVQMQFVSPEMEVEPNSNAEPIGYQIIVNPSTRQFTIKEEAVPMTVPNTQTYTPLEGVDVWDPPASVFLTQGTNIESLTYWYSTTTLALTEDPPPLNTDLCKTWDKVWIARDWDSWFGWNCYFHNPTWDYFKGWAANPTPFPLNTHWFVRKTENCAPTYEFLYFPNPGYWDWYWHFTGKGIYWNADFLDDNLTTVVKHFPHTYYRIGDGCSGVYYRGVLNLVYLGEAIGLLHTHWYVQGVKKY